MTTTEDKLETLTPVQEKLMSEVSDRYISELTAPPKFNLRHVNRWLAVAYGMYDMPVPSRVEIVDSPAAAMRLASELLGEPQRELDWCGVGDGGWVSFYDYFAQIGVLTDEEAVEVRALRDFGRSAWDSLLLDECAIVVRRPKLLRVDDAGNLHSSSGPSIEWADGERDWAHHGIWIPERMVSDPRGYSREEYMAITNTEERRALGELAGWEWVISLLGGAVVDSWTDPETSLEYELVGCAGGQKLLRKQSPELSGSRRGVQRVRYSEPVHEQLVTARAARKWQAIPQLTPEQCESNPVLVYGVET
jgi:hypothetical protein